MKSFCGNCGAEIVFEVDNLEELDFTQSECENCTKTNIVFQGKVYCLDNMSVNEMFNAGFFKNASRDPKAMILFDLKSSEELGIVGNPKESALKYKAYEHGHSSGLEETWGWMQDLAELIK